MHQGQQVIEKAPWLSPGGCPIGDPDRLRRRALGSQQNSCPSGLYEFVLDALTLVEGPEPGCFDRRETISTVPYGSARPRRLSSLRKRDRVEWSGTGSAKARPTKRRKLSRSASASSSPGSDSPYHCCSK